MSNTRLTLILSRLGAEDLRAEQTFDCDVFERNIGLAPGERKDVRLAMGATDSTFLLIVASDRLHIGAQEGSSIALPKGGFLFWHKDIDGSCPLGDDLSTVSLTNPIDAEVAVAVRIGLVEVSSSVKTVSKTRHIRSNVVEENSA